MIKLIHTELRRVLASRVFLIGAALHFLLGGALGLSTGQLFSGNGNYSFRIDYHILALAVSCAVIILEYTRDNAYGTLRGKMMLFSRGQVFFGELASTMLTAAAMWLCMMLPMLIFTLGIIPMHTTLGDSRTAQLLAVLLLLHMSSAMVCVIFAMLVNREAAVIILLLAFCGASFFYGRELIRVLHRNKVLYEISYDEQEIIDGVEYDEEMTFNGDPSKVGTVPLSELTPEDGVTAIPNSDYVGGVPRLICKALAFSNPVTQLDALDQTMQFVGGGTDYYEAYLKEIELYDQTGNRESAGRLPYYPLYSAGFIAAAGAAGYAVFRKRNIN